VTKDQKKKLLKYFVSQTNLADQLGLDRRFVNHWFTGKSLIPLKYVLKIQILTNGSIQMSDLLGEKDKCYLQTTQIIKE